MKKNNKKQNSNSLNLQPQSSNQSEYIRSLEDNVATIGLGFAGSGKTYIPTTMAAQAMIDSRIQKIILTRPAKSESQTLGYGPGTIEEKLLPWLAPYIGTLRKHLPHYDKLVEAGRIEMKAFEHLQGQSLDDCYVLLDEAQFTTPYEMQMFLKRTGKNVRMAISGDLNQAKAGSNSGLAEVVKLCQDPTFPEFYNNIGLIHFDNPDDILRSDFCRDITVGYDRYHTMSK